MSEGQAEEKLKIKTSTRPEIQAKVDEKVIELHHKYPTTNLDILNDFARRETAKETRIERLRESAGIDSLTGLKNRKGFEIELEKAFSLSKRYNRALSLIYIDLDNTKFVNDTYGHLAGDKLIKRVAEIIKKNFRKTDVAARILDEGEYTTARIGGDEFAVILPETSAENSVTAAERLRVAIESELLAQMSDIIKDRKDPLTASIGCAGYYNSNCGTTKQLQNLADIALYNSKKTMDGTAAKNKVTLYAEGMTMPENATETIKTASPEPAIV